MSRNVTMLVLCLCLMMANMVLSFVTIGRPVIINKLNNGKNKNKNMSIRSRCTPDSAEYATMSTFKIDKSVLVTDEELSDENLVKIVLLEATDIQCNEMAWKCLGYEFGVETQQWEAIRVFPKWKSKYPSPPDLIGVTRTYADVAIDRPVRDASMNLMRTVPRDYKGGVKNLAHVGFKGWKLNQLTPNKTRRAQLCNWIIFYREKLHGKSIEDLKAERELENAAAAAAASAPETATEVAARDKLPSEKMYQKLRVDDFD